MPKHFKHLKPEEAAVWKRFLDSTLPNGSFEYDVHVGDGFHEEHNGLCNVACDDFKLLTQKRIDVVNHTPTDILLIEVTPRLSARAIGQIMSYELLYKAKYAPSLPVSKAIVTSATDIDLAVVAERYGIEVIVV